MHDYQRTRWVYFQMRFERLINCLIRNDPVEASILRMGWAPLGLEERRLYTGLS